MNNTKKTRRGSAEWKQKISETRKRLHKEGILTPWNKGLPSERQAFYGKTHSDETKRKMSAAHKGPKNPMWQKTFSEEHRRKLSESNKNKPKSEQHKENMSKAQRGKNHPMWGKQHSEEARRKMSESRSGEKSHTWRGGISFIPYTPEFNEKLKRQIRERDNYTCQYSGTFGKCVHHIDYDKTNNDPSNLITLSTSIHCKTGFNRETWESLFKSLRT